MNRRFYLPMWRDGTDMQTFQETRPEFSTLSPADILKRLLLTAQPRRSAALAFMGGRSRRRRLSHGDDMADFRPYAPGDDTRHLDWPALARLDQPIIRLFEASDDNPQMILLDASKSMLLGRPTKWSAACWTAMDAAMYALRRGERLGVTVAAGDLHSPTRSLKKMQHPRDLIELIATVRKITPDGICQLQRELRLCAVAAPSSALITVISDLLPNAPELPPGFHRQVNLIRVLSSVEIDPTSALSHQLVDIETGKKFFARRDAQSLAAYRAARDEHGRSIERIARSTGGFAMDIHS
ncbi:MAG: DUF58 domain-containing protein [Phycisphaerae bacterium]